MGLSSSGGRAQLLLGLLLEVETLVTQSLQAVDGNVRVHVGELVELCDRLDGLLEKCVSPFQLAITAFLPGLKELHVLVVRRETAGPSPR